MVCKSNRLLEPVSYNVLSFSKIWGSCSGIVFTRESAVKKTFSDSKLSSLCTVEKSYVPKSLCGNFCKSTVRIKLHKKMDIYLPLKEISDDFNVVATCP